MLKFCLTVDCERFISFKQGNPEWGEFQKIKGRINNLIKSLRYNKKGFELVFNEIERQNFKSNFMIVGKLFRPAPSKVIEWGYHTLGHLPLTLLSNEEIEKQVKNIYGLVSFTPPMWRVEDLNNPDPGRIFRELKKQRYKSIVYMGVNQGIKSLYNKKIISPERRYGLKCVYVSNYLEGNSSKKHIKDIKKEIINNLNKDAVYLLSTHDFTYRNIKNLREIVIFVKRLEKDKKLKIITLKDA
ncbi:MAG: hypothetical protein WCX73_00615 [Candidatus Pacearchaeota archaeon]|jgi:hypothetical protein